MTEQEQINEMLLYVPQTIVAYDANPKGQHLYGEQRQQIAKALYDIGYRKIPDDIRELIDLLAEGANIKEKLDEIKRLEEENEELKAKLEARLTCDFVKTAQKQAQIEVLNRLKSLSIYDDNYLDGYVFIDDIDKLLEELKK